MKDNAAALYTARRHFVQQSHQHSRARSCYRTTGDDCGPPLASSSVSPALMGWTMAKRSGSAPRALRAEIRRGAFSKGLIGKAIQSDRIATIIEKHSAGIPEFFKKHGINEPFNTEAFKSSRSLSPIEKSRIGLAWITLQELNDLAAAIREGDCEQAAEFAYYVGFLTASNRRLHDAILRTANARRGRKIDEDKYGPQIASKVRALKKSQPNIKHKVACERAGSDLGIGKRKAQQLEGKYRI